MNFFRLIFLVLVVITFSQKVMSDSHDQNIVEKAKVKTAIIKNIFPNMPSSCSKANAVIDTPLIFWVYTPLIKMIIAVIEQTIIVSIKGPSMATKPSRTGSLVFAAPCAIVSVPVPASLEKRPLLTPTIIIVPIAPPATDFPVNAS